MKRFCTLALVLSSFASLAMPLSADTAYIGDTVYVPLRSGPGSNYRIVHRGLKTGTELTLISSKQNEGYYQVKTESGLEGYVPSQYVLLEQPAALQLEAMQATNVALLKQITTLNQKVETLNNDLREKTDDLATSTNQLQAIDKELQHVKSVSARSLELDSNNIKLRTQNAQLFDKVDTLKANNQQLADNAQQRWYLYGAGTLFLGLLMGLMAPALRPKKKDNTWV